MDGKIGGCAGFPALSPRPLSGGLGRKQLSLSLLLVAFHRFRGFLRASRDSLCGGHCSQAWRPFPSASSAGVSFMLWPLRAAFRVRGANRPRGDFVLAGFSQAGISEVSPGGQILSQSVNSLTSDTEEATWGTPSL